MNKIISVVMLVLIILGTLYLSTTTTGQQEALKFLIIYAPSFSYEEALNITESLQFLKNYTFKGLVEADPPYSLIFHEAKIINNTWDLSKGIVFDNNTVALPNGTYRYTYEIIPKVVLTNIWGSLDTMFINVFSVDPRVHERAFNPYYNITGNTIDPEIFRIPINGSAYWQQLDTNINATVTSKYIVLNIGDYVKNIKISRTSNVSSTLKINISRNDLTVSPGTYYIKFRILNVTSDYVVLFTPGTRKADGWFSQYFGKTELEVPLYSALKYINILGDNASEWLINEYISFYKKVLTTAYKYKAATIDFVEYPLIEYLKEKAYENSLPHSKLDKLLKDAYDGISEIINITRETIGENIVVAIYSPYTFVSPSMPGISGLKQVLPGLYRVEPPVEDVLKSLADKNIEFKTLSIGGKLYVLIRGKDIGVGNGVILVKGEGLRRILYTYTLDDGNIAGFLSALTKGYGVGLVNLNNEISLLNIKIKDLESQVKDMNTTLKKMNQTLFNVNMTLSKCKAEKINLTDEITELKSKVSTYKEKEEQALTYAYIGSISVLVVVVVLLYIATRGIRKK